MLCFGPIITHHQELTFGVKTLSVFLYRKDRQTRVKLQHYEIEQLKNNEKVSEKKKFF